MKILLINLLIILNLFNSKNDIFLLIYFEDVFNKFIDFIKLTFNYKITKNYL